ncbi:hypothetical protein P8936_02315 [Edaphobacter paludis]|uniref:Uncharacterized protein n=1 Tax=Edaphobacter paludis TaxID=3035702 RepID=A0AAU7D072_9BACT
MKPMNTLSSCPVCPTAVRQTDSPNARKLTAVLGLLLLITTAGIAQRQDNNADNAFLPGPARSVSTVPANGDVNPYGVAFITSDFQIGSGPLKNGDILVSNFNNSMNLQGTGTTIVRISRMGKQSLFFQGKVPLGLSTALGTLQAGFVVVGNFPSTDGTIATATPGSLLVVNNHGQLKQTITSPEIQGPWDMALVDHGGQAIAFIANALTGTVSRLDFTVSAAGLTLTHSKTIASGYIHRGDPVTFVVSPTGLVYDERSDILYVASTGDNEVFAVKNASERTSDGGVGRIVYQDNVHLHGALAMAEAPNGHLLVSNSDGINSDPAQPSEIVEFTKDGTFVKQLSVDPAQGGAFGLAVHNSDDVATFAAVDDNTATLTIWQINQ